MFSFVHPGKLCVFGSGHFFADQYLENECNDLIRELIFNYLGGLTDLHLHPVDVEDPDVWILRIFYYHDM